MSFFNHSKFVLVGCSHSGIRLSRLNILATSLILLLFAGVTAQAQTTFASITGAVTDSSGAVVPNAIVLAKNLATNIQTKTTSNEVGDYTVAQLKEGTYSLTANAPGFNEMVVQDIVLVARDIRRIDVVMSVGTTTSAIEVKAGATLIETDTARISDTMDAVTLDTLAQNSRSIWAPLALNPSVLQSADSSTIRFAGSGSNQSKFTIDGITASDPVDSTQMGQLMNYMEWIGEVKIDMANNTADVGTIGQVTLISKSGTNNFHGSVFDYYSTHGFRARDPFASSSQIGVVHQPGYGVGGPVYIPKIYNGKNKTFFYTSYETTRGSTIYSFLEGTVPTQAMRNGDFSSMLPGTVIYDPTNNQPFSGNQIPAARLNPVSQKLQDQFYPLPNYGDTSTFQPLNFRLPDSRPKDYATYYTIRGDQQITDKTSIYGRYTHNDVNYPYEWGALPGLGQWSYGRFNEGGLVSLTHTFSTSLVFESRWGLGTDRIVEQAPFSGSQLVTTLGLQGLDPNLPNLQGMPSISIPGFTRLSEIAYSNSRNFMQDYQEYLNWFRGRHSVKMGVELTRAERDSLAASSALFGAESFSNRFTTGSVGQGNPYADFLLGIPTTASRAFAPISTEASRWQYDFFFNDDFKVNPRLTLNLGVRYELHLPWQENSDRMAVFDVGSGKIVVPDSALSRVSPLFPSNYVGIEGAKAAGLPETLIRADTNNFAPRVGLAYRPWDNNTVFRAGFGVFYDVAPLLLQMGGVSPFTLTEQPYTNPLSNPIQFPQVFPSAGTEGPSSVSLPNAVNPNLKIPYSLQYNFTIERQQWNTGFRASYIGTETRQGVWGYDSNSPVPNTLPYVDKARPFPQFPSIDYFTNGAGHDYNALTVEVRRELSKSLHFQSSWTWARDIGDEENLGISEDPFDRQRDVGVSADIPTHRFTSNMVYELPFGRGKHWLSSASRPMNWLVGGWQISATYSLFSSRFMTALWDGPDPTGTVYSSDATPAYVEIRPDLLKNPNLPSGQQSVNEWFDTSAFGAPQPGQFGTSAKNVIKGPGVNVCHAGLFKELVFKEKGPVLRLEFTGTNIFNHPNWGYPDQYMADGPAFGTISDAGGINNSTTGDMSGPRALRLGVRLRW